MLSRSQAIALLAVKLQRSEDVDEVSMTGSGVQYYPLTSITLWKFGGLTFVWADFWVE